MGNKNFTSIPVLFLSMWAPIKSVYLWVLLCPNVCFSELSFRLLTWVTLTTIQGALAWIGVRIAFSTIFEMFLPPPCWGYEHALPPPPLTSLLQPVGWRCLVWWHARDKEDMCVHNQGCSDCTWHSTGWCCQGEHRFIMHWTLHSCLLIACSQTFTIAKFLWPP